MRGHERGFAPLRGRGLKMRMRARTKTRMRTFDVGVDLGQLEVDDRVGCKQILLVMPATTDWYR